MLTVNAPNWLYNFDSKHLHNRTLLNKSLFQVFQRRSGNNAEQQPARYFSINPRDQQQHSIRQALPAVLAGTQNGDDRSASCHLSSLISTKYNLSFGKIAIDDVSNRENMCINRENTLFRHCIAIMCGFSGWIFLILIFFLKICYCSGGKMSSSGGVKSTNAVSLKPIEVPQALQNGEKFIKWDEVRISRFFPFLQDF